MRTVLIGAGGTGGHVFPGIAVADELVRRDAATRVVFAGTARGLETQLVPKAGYALELLPILPLIGVGALRTLLGLLALPVGAPEVGARGAAPAAGRGARHRRLRGRADHARRRAASACAR